MHESIIQALRENGLPRNKRIGHRYIIILVSGGRSR